ncbi:hypothetical protein TIFTF001_037081 [Ficus carica]|uniref:Retrotransposon gag domain-containing protein n=1 Tax=Ficus carica TaxID=3494 RepID=A0AA88E4L2_FICCA|nr:hypothetical protein TIFTF001_037081 [Ficus carica]
MVAPIDPQIDADHRAGTAFNMMMQRFFDGYQTPCVLMEWIHNLEVAFRVCHVRDQLQVNLATMRLRGHAFIWWLNIPNLWECLELSLNLHLTRSFQSR